MAETQRRALDPPTLAALVRRAGLDLSADELAALLPPTAAIYAALDALDALGLAEAEPATYFALDAE